MKKKKKKTVCECRDLGPSKKITVMYHNKAAKRS